MRVGADAVVGVGFGEDDFAGLADDEGGREGETPGVVTVDVGDVDEDGAVVETEVLGDGVGDAEGIGETGAGVGEQRKGEVVVLDGEVVLACELGEMATRSAPCSRTAGKAACQASSSVMQ